MDARVTTNVSDQLDRLGLRVVWGAATHVGNVRAVNEDCFLATAGMWLVADGMGGHSAGRTASEIVIGAFTERASGEPVRLSEVPSLLDRANREVRRKAAAEGYETMGATVCGIALVDNGGEDALLVFNIGDSRSYQIMEGGALVQLTTDHSYVQELVDQGKISPEEARTHPDRNVVSRAIGITDSIAPDFLVLPKSPASRFLLCSDGVSGEIDDKKIAEILTVADTPADASKRLIREVVAGPARDNATAVVLDVSWNTVEQTDGDGRDLQDITTPRRETPNAKSRSSKSDTASGQPVINHIPGFAAAAPATKSSTEMVQSVPIEVARARGDTR